MSSSTEALALERPQLKFHPIQEEGPLNKKPKLATNGCDGLEEHHSTEVESMSSGSVGEAAMKHLQSSKSSMTMRLAGQNTATLPFSLPLISMSQNSSLLTQPLSSFLPQNFFNTTSNGVQPDSKVE